MRNKIENYIKNNIEKVNFGYIEKHSPKYNDFYFNQSFDDYYILNDNFCM